MADAVLPTDPGRLQVTLRPNPQQLHNQVSGALSSLFLALVAVVERTGEIGLRRARGARPRHIAAHLLTESATCRMKCA